MVQVADDHYPYPILTLMIGMVFEIVLINLNIFQEMLFERHVHALIKMTKQFSKGFVSLHFLLCSF